MAGCGGDSETHEQDDTQQPVAPERERGQRKKQRPRGADLALSSPASSRPIAMPPPRAPDWASLSIALNAWPLSVIDWYSPATGARQRLKRRAIQVRFHDGAGLHRAPARLAHW